MFNLKDKEENKSGKGLGLSLFGVLDGEKESKNAEVFERLAATLALANSALTNSHVSIQTSKYQEQNEKILTRMRKNLPL